MLDTPEEIGAALTARKQTFFRAQGDGWARTQPVASDADPSSCVRRQVLEVVAWKEREPFDEHARERMDAGQRIERSAVRLLQDMGFEVLEAQSPLELRHRKTGAKVLGGKIDGVLLYETYRIVLEIKLMAPWMLDRVNTWQDLLSVGWWTPKYVYQGQAYMLGKDLERLVFLFTDGKRWKFIGMTLDLEMAELVWGFAEHVVDKIAEYRRDEPLGKKSLPDFTKDVAQCGRCPFFRRACNPEITTEHAGFISDPALEEDMARWYELKPGKREYDSIDRRIKPRLREGQRLKLVGDFMVEVAKNGAVTIDKLGVVLAP
jgi:hypothetical protein